jgi:hypothetical protein
MPFAIRQTRVAGGTQTVSGTSATFSTAHFTSNTLSGSLLFCLITALADVESSGGTLPASVPVIDAPTTSGVTWVLATQKSCPSGPTFPNLNNGAAAVALYYAAGASVLSSSTDTSVTATATAPGGSPDSYSVQVDCLLFEITGAATSSALDTTSAGAAGLVGTTPNPGNLTTSQANEFIFAAVMTIVDFTGVSHGSGFSPTASTFYGYGFGQTETSGGAGSVSCSFTGTADCSWCAIGAAFLPPGSPPPPTGGRIQGFLFGF